MRQELMHFKKYLPLLYELVMRDIKVKYRRSIIGVFWTLLNPLLMMTVLSIVFSHLFRFDIENYALYLLSGQVIFNFFSESTTNAMSAIIQNASLLKKVYIPKYLFTLARVASSTINVLASFCALIIVMLFSHVELRFTVFFAIVPLLLLVVFCVGVGLLLSSLAVKFLDIMHLYTVLLTVLMYLMPVIYPITMLPEGIRVIVAMNPLTQILEFFRGVMFYHTLPSVESFLYCVIASAGMLLIGAYVFHRVQDQFVFYV